MKAGLLLAFCAGASLVSATVLADGITACVEASDKGQTLRDAHRLIEARDQFRACAQESCPALVQSDCATWLTAVEISLPTVVITVVDGAGARRVDASVSVDGWAPWTEQLDGQAVPMNPGLHLF